MILKSRPMVHLLTILTYILCQIRLNTLAAYSLYNLPICLITHTTLNAYLVT
jgi:hypothetical protein